jgi:hypothetical protein
MHDKLPEGRKEAGTQQQLARQQQQQQQQQQDPNEYSYE